MLEGSDLKKSFIMRHFSNIILKRPRYEKKSPSSARRQEYGSTKMIYAAQDAYTIKAITIGLHLGHAKC
jgi:hypothetical protein